MWEPQHLTTLWASTACYRDSFTFLLFCLLLTWSHYSRWNFFWILYKDSVCTSQETHYISTTKIRWLLLLRETIHVYSENHVIPEIHSVSITQSFSILNQAMHIKPCAWKGQWEVKNYLPFPRVPHIVTDLLNITVSYYYENNIFQFRRSELC
jgi:hypothetical protein